MYKSEVAMRKKQGSSKFLFQSTYIYTHICRCVHLLLFKLYIYIYILLYTKKKIVINFLGYVKSNHKTQD